MDGNLRLSNVEKASYGILSLGRNLAWQMTYLFLMYFYTDVFGIPLVYMTPMFLIFSVWEGLSRQLIGFIIGKTQTRWGKYRPYFLFTILPFSILFVMVFLTPEVSEILKVIYAYATFITWSFVCNMIAIAHTSILPTMSKDPLERTQINSLKIMCSVAAFLIVSYFLLGTVDKLGGGDQQRGFLFTSICIAIITAVVQIFSYKNIKERHTVAKTQKISLSIAIKSIMDRRILLLLFVYAATCIGNAFKNQSTTYYFIYVLDRADYVGTFFLIGTGSSLLMHLFVKRLISHIKIETAMLLGIAGSVVGILICFAAGGNLVFLSFGNFVFGLMSALPANLTYLILAGLIDEKNKQFNSSVNSWLYAGQDNLAKIGTGIGSTVLSKMLETLGYIPNAQQTALTILGIRLGFSIGTSVAYLLCFVLMVLFILASKKSSRELKGSAV